MARVTSDTRDPERQAYDHELRLVLEGAIDSLPGLYRTVFILRSVEGMSVAETAGCLDIGAEAVKTRLHTAQAYPFHLSRCDRVVEAFDESRPVCEATSHLPAMSANTPADPVSYRAESRKPTCDRPPSSGYRPESGPLRSTLPRGADRSDRESLPVTRRTLRNRSESCTGSGTCAASDRVRGACESAMKSVSSLNKVLRTGETSLVRADASYLVNGGLIRLEGSRDARRRGGASPGVGRTQ
jgi:hypothetical protein